MPGLNKRASNQTETTSTKMEDLANALHISVDALLVDSLDYSLSSSDSDLHRLLLDCNETEQEIIIRTARELKATLVSLGI